MKINKEGYRIIAVSGLICLVLWLLIYYFQSHHLGISLLATSAVILIAFWFFIIAFFREPKRAKIHDPELVFSPCDGRVVVTEVVYEDEYLIAVSKPRGMPTHPSRGNSLPTLAEGIMAYFGGNFVFRAINMEFCMATAFPKFS